MTMWAAGSETGSTMSTQPLPLTPRWRLARALERSLPNCGQDPSHRHRTQTPRLISQVSLRLARRAAAIAS